MQNENEEKAIAEIELQYQNLISFMNSIACMTAGKDKVNLYQKAEKQFSALGGYKDSDSLMKSCKQNIKVTEEEIKKDNYNWALYHKEKAKTSEDYKKAADQFRKFKGYLDAEDQALHCVKLSAVVEKRGIIRKFCKIGIAILCILIIVCGFKAPITKYVLANTSMAIGSYHFAAGMFDRLDNYKNSENKLIECRYKNALELQSKGQYSSAEKIFAGLGNYKDSANKVTTLQKLILRKSKLGDKVTIGNESFIILEKLSDRALLFKKNGLKEIPYHSKAMNVTWETCELRTYLNQQYFKDTFSEQEQKNIVLTKVNNNDNSDYGTDGGNDTDDYLYILSVEEVLKYSKNLPNLDIDTWLRTPGVSQMNAAFLSADNQIMDYGYDVTSNHITVHPVMWYTFGEVVGQ